MASVKQEIKKGSMSFSSSGSIEGMMARAISSSDSIPRALNKIQTGIALRTKGKPTCKASDFLRTAKVTRLTWRVSGDKQEIEEYVAI